MKTEKSINQNIQILNPSKHELTLLISFTTDELLRLWYE